MATSLVAMATSLENFGNEFEITNHENTTIGEKNLSMVHTVAFMANFGYDIQNSVAMATSPENFSNTSEIADP